MTLFKRVTTPLAPLLTKERVSMGLLILGVLLLAYIAINVSSAPSPFSVGDEIEWSDSYPRTKVLAIRGDFFCIRDGKYSTTWINSKEYKKITVYKSR